MPTKRKSSVQTRPSIVALDHHTPVPESKPRPTEDQIRARAYQLFIERGCIPGNPVVDWLDAEHQLIVEFGSRAA
ncbi:MAG: DUF2934 domain-containing protein [Phycisphaerales bacterium]|nr:DUF2934 domain-containing protein [Phycisphaerales bacterium]